MGIIAVPTVSYLLFYNFNIGLIHSSIKYAIGYLGSAFSLSTFLFLTSFQKSDNPTSTNTSIPKTICFCILQLIFTFTLFLIPWALDTFPLSNADAVLYAVLSPVDGANAFLLETLKEKVFLATAVACIAILTSQIVLSVLWARYGMQGNFSLGYLKNKCYIGKSWHNNWNQISKFFTLFLFVCTLINFILIPSIFYSPEFKACFAPKIDSTFYKEHYIDPNTIQTEQPTKQKNLVFLFLESMTDNFQNYTPELNAWKNAGVHFTPGSQSVSGTSWTIAGITAALCGLPINMPLTNKEYLGKLPTYLPKATCLMEAIKNAGYNQLAIQGSSADFTQFRDFWGVHGNVEIRDNNYYKEHKRIPKDYYVFWGMEDRKTLDFAKEALDSLANLSSPFALYISTIDTHQPEGYLDSSCHYAEDSKYKNVLHCSSAMIGDFLSWMKSQPWYENTIVAVAGDHILQALAAKAGLPKDEKLYTTAFILNSEFKNEKKTTFLYQFGFSTVCSGGYGLEPARSWIWPRTFSFF